MGRKHKFDKEARCINCKMTKVELDQLDDLNFMEEILSCNPKEEDKKKILHLMFKEKMK